jgi:TRAP transporter 4TM/12TM fusion protein
VDGPFTIPAMKKAGYPPHYAAAIEAVTSTGGALMPPVMGASAFVMASFLGVPYAEVILCAAVPAILYFAGLFFQVDAYARRAGLQGVPKNELPSLKKTLREGWFYCFALIAMVVLIFYLQIEAQAPFYSMLILFLCAQFRKETRISGRDFLVFLAECGKLMAQITTVLAGIGLVIGSLSMTGVAHAFSRELVLLVGGNIFLLLLAGALTSFILGMGMTATACYIFLAITLAPALVKVGLNQTAVHLFVLYWGLVSFITPPVALGAIAAAPIAGASPMKTGFAAMRLGASIYFVPFFFVLNPELILIGSTLNIILSVTTAVIGIYLISGALEGYLFLLERLDKPLRVLMFIAGILLAAPYRVSELAAVVFFGLGLGYHFWAKTRAESQEEKLSPGLKN